MGLITADSSNTTPGLSGPMPQASINDWSHFDNPYRTWGIAGASVLFDPSNSGPCTTGICQLFDYMPTAGDSVLKNQFGQWQNDGTCPTSADSGADPAAVVADSSGRTFLAHAVEVMNSWMNPNGNFDGLCESNEVCIFTPNIGSYQGVGDPSTTTPCLLAGGNGVTNVTLVAYPTN